MRKGDSYIRKTEQNPPGGRSENSPGRSPRQRTEPWVGMPKSGLAPEGRPKRRAQIALRYGAAMSHTYCSSLFHCVFSTKERRKIISPGIQPRLWAFMGGIARNHKMTALAIGGTDDHVHMLLSLPPTLTIAKAMEVVKSVSSHWMHETCAIGPSNGRQATVHSPSDRLRRTSRSRTLRARRNIIKNATSRQSSWRFSKSTESTTILATSGAEVRPSLRDLPIPSFMQSQGSVRCRGLLPGLSSFPPSGRGVVAQDCAAMHVDGVPESVARERMVTIYLITPRSLRSKNAASIATSSPAALSSLSAFSFSSACVVFSFAASSTRNAL